MLENGVVPRQPTLLIIMDGVGLNPSRLNNGVAEATTPNLDRLYSSYPTTVLEASGRAVGLPEGQMGNSEVGHLTLGCGSVLRQDLVRINDAVDDGSLARNPALTAALEAALRKSRPLHLLGLVSDGGIHSHVDHLLELIRVTGAAGVVPLLHMITDGRDTAPQCATKFVSLVEPVLREAGGAIASICGRFYAMDRDQRWERVETAWQLLVNGVGTSADNAVAGIEAAWAEGIHDEFIQPIVLPEFSPLMPDDEVLFFNFRNDRPRELSSALASEHFDGFARPANSQVCRATTLITHFRCCSKRKYRM